MKKSLQRMKKNKISCIGSIGKPRGLKGEFFLNSFCEPQENIINYIDKVRFSDDILIKFQYIKKNNSKFLAKITDINDIDEIKELTNQKIFIYQDDLPKLSSGEIYWNELIGMQVIDNNENKVLGIVKGLNNYGSNDCLIVNPTKESVDDEKRLIPYINNIFIRSVDTEKKIIKVNWQSDY